MDEHADLLGFSERWFALGLITKLQHQELINEFHKGEDTNPEHYRWRVFCDFMRKSDQLSADLMRQLYFLGEMDTDHSMGGSMMVAILKRTDCPMDIIESAKTSDRKYLQKIANNKP